MELRAEREKERERIGHRCVQGMEEIRLCGSRRSKKTRQGSRASRWEVRQGRVTLVVSFHSGCVSVAGTKVVDRANAAESGSRMA